MKIDTNNRIIIDGQYTGLAVKQAPSATVVFTPECTLTGRAYHEHPMPCVRYSTTHPNPASGAAGCHRLEADVRNLMSRIGALA